MTPPWCRLAGSNGLPKEPARGNYVASWRDIGINYLSVSVDGAVDVMPTATNASIGLVHAPVQTDRIAVPPGHFTNSGKKRGTQR